MKRAAYISLSLCPYGYIAAMGLLFALSRTVPALDDYAVIFAVIGISLLLPGIFSLWYLFAARRCTPAQLASGNWKLKLWTLPAMALAMGILVYAVISTNRAAAEGAQEGGLAVFLWFLLALPVFAHGLCQLWTTAICASRISISSPALTLLHWIPVAAFAASWRLRRKWKE